jgi:hypothetical protein
MPTTRDLDTELDERLQRYAASGMSRAGMLAQLTLSGYPVELLRSRFPEMPDVAFGLGRPSTPAPTLDTRPQGRAPTNPTPPTAGASNPRAPDNSPDAPSLAVSRQGESHATNAGTLMCRQGSQQRQDAGASRPSARLHGRTRAVPERDIPGAAMRNVALGRDTEEGGISFHYVPLIQCSFPHADPGEARSFTRKNGWLELTLGTTRPETGLPYGVPARLLTIYAASEAVRTKSPEIFLGTSVLDFLRRLDVPITRGDRGSLRVYANQLLKLIHCTLTIDENIRDASGRTGLHIRQALFAEEARLWWDDDTRGVGQGSSLVLSSVLFHSILDRSAPLSTNAIKQLRKSPMDLDVYAWLVHRLYHLGKPSTVTWTQLSEQFGHGYSELRKFRRFFIDSLKRVQAVYPEAKLKVADVGVILLPSKPHLSPTTVAITRR